MHRPNGQKPKDGVFVAQLEHDTGIECLSADSGLRFSKPTQ